MLCPDCGSSRVVDAGNRYLRDGSPIKRRLCKDCGHRFSDGHNRLNVVRDSKKNSQLCAILEEAKKLDSQAEINACAGEETIKGTLIQFALYLHKNGKTESTIDTYTRNIRRISKHADLNDSESVKEFIADQRSENTKANYCVCYTAFLTWKGTTWQAPKYSSRSPIPEFIPTEAEIDQLTAGCGKKTATQLQMIKETGMRIGEAMSLKWTALNEKDQILTLNTPEKHSLPRIFKISPKLLMMIQGLPKKHERIFGRTLAKDAERVLARSRQLIAEKVGNPRIGKIHFHLIRHWFGTMEYHKTHDPDFVRRRLGHRSILSTQIYINMEQVLFSEKVDDFHVKAVDTVEEAMALLEVGFEYVTEIDGKKLFRKRK
jgi:integrase